MDPAGRRVGAVELVSVDSMAVYRGMDIGTAKPTPEVRARVPYHLVDLVDPGQEFTAQQFQRAARRALAGIAGRGHTALLVGGTGLYLRSVVDDLTFPGRFPEVAAALSERIDRAGPVGSPGQLAVLRQLHHRLGGARPGGRRPDRPGQPPARGARPRGDAGLGPSLLRVRTGLERYPPSRVAMVGVDRGTDELDRRIGERFDRLMDQGLLEEVRGLAGRPGGISRTARQALGYRELLAHLEEGVPLGEAVDRGRPAHPDLRPSAAGLVPARSPYRVVGPVRRSGRCHRDPGREPPRGHRGGGGGRMDQHEMTPTVEPHPPLRLTKHHGAGNDFLVLVDPDDRSALGPDVVRALCDRRFGVGADGVIRILAGAEGAALTMDLANADGGAAEMSGNGMRCLAQAAVRAGLVTPPDFAVATLGRGADRAVRTGCRRCRAGLGLGGDGAGPARS